ncbi:unnamed protein product, partial [Rhizoctonia solani]
HTAASSRGVFAQPSLNRFLALGRPAWRQVRETVARLLDADEPALRDNGALRQAALRPQREVELLLPAEIGDYTDFYASRAHAEHVGTLFRGKDNALMPNWLHLPVGYHGRASSVVAGGTDVRRPNGQLKPPDADAPRFGPSRQLDFELEAGWLIGARNEQGRPIAVANAEDHLFGLALVNDWSARDIQAWEYQPLGPFLGKSFATSVSPWVMPLEALEPFRVPAGRQDPAPLPYLRSPAPTTFDIRLEAYLQAGAMARPERIAATNYRELYWTIAQQIAHHTSGGCNLRPGDLLASGTISGAAKDARGCMLELTWRGAEPLRLGGDETRAWLEDGDLVVLTGWCQGDGYRVGFGELAGRILPALPYP